MLADRSQRRVVTHFYHIWTGGGWQDIAAAHTAALDEAGFDGERIYNKVSRGFEDVTLNRLREFCLTADPDTPVLYAHAKGSFHDMHLRDKVTGRVYEPSVQEIWREDMTDRLVRMWRSRTRELDTADVVGLYYVTPPECTHPYFAGNFWWARAGYVATLPELPELTAANRWLAEKWITSGNPRVHALSRGFASVPLPPTPGATAVEYVEVSNATRRDLVRLCKLTLLHATARLFRLCKLLFLICSRAHGPGLP